MHWPDSRSTNKESPTYPSMAFSAGMTSSRTYAIPSSMDEGRAWIVVERAYTAHPFLLGGAPVAPPATD
jgi:hypothetical protein